VPSARHLLSRGFRGVQRVAASTPRRLAFFATLALVATWQYLASAHSLNTFRDAHVLSHYEWVARTSVLKFHELPLWDPYYCGGMYLLGTPQARFVSPTFLLTLLFGEPVGESLAAFALLVVGLEGAFRYARTRQASAASALLAAPLFGLSGIFAYSAQLGWINFFGFALVPWIATGVRRALQGDLRGAVVAAVAVAWCTGFGGTYAIPLAAVWCAFEVAEALARAARKRSWERARRILITAAAIGSLAAGLAAVRLWAVVETLGDAPRVVGGAPGNDYGAIAQMLFLNLQDDGPPGQFFLGGLAAPAVLAAILLFAMKRRWAALSLPLYGVIFTWLATGYASTPSLFAAMQSLPVYGTLRYPERYLILLALVVSTLAAQGLTLVTAAIRAKPKRPRLFGWLKLALVVTLLLALGPLLRQHVASADMRTLAPLAQVIARPFHQARGNRLELAYYAPMSRGSLSCWDAYPVPESPLLEGDLLEEARLADPTAGHVKEHDWSPNRIDLDVELDRPTQLRVNQNWHRGWRASVGEVGADRGLLVVELPAGRYPLSLRFSPRSAGGGLFVTLTTLAALGIAFARARGRGTLSLSMLSAAALVSPIAMAVALALFREPPLPVRVPLSPTGEPIVLDELPRGSVPINARFESGVHLVGAFLDTAKAQPKGTVTLELDWMRDSTIEPGIGIFVHIDPSKGDGLNGDHVDLSQALLFDAAPPGKVLRDLVPITLPKDAGGKEWKVSVGLWRVLRSGSRVRIVDPGKGSVTGDEVLVSKFDVK